MATLPKQTVIACLEDPADEQAEIEAGYLWREQLWSTMRTFASSYVGPRGRGLDGCAAELDARWSPKGRSVSASVLGAALRDCERNYFRAEWLDWFAARSEDVARLLARRVKPIKTDAERLADLEAELREVLSHKQAEQVLRRARTR